MAHDDRLVDFIRENIKNQARQLAENASFSGEMGDGGASRLEDKLAYWIDGIQFASTGKTIVFSTLVDQFNKERDPEYNEYLRLKARFEGRFI